MVVDDEKKTDEKEQYDAKHQDDEKEPQSEVEHNPGPPPQCFCSFRHGDTEFEDDDNVG